MPYSREQRVFIMEEYVLTGSFVLIRERYEAKHSGAKVQSYNPGFREEIPSN